eukprot:COSAG04_NODE_453_length_14110_cov_262.397473_2_plen_468_part_00
MSPFCTPTAQHTTTNSTATTNNHQHPNTNPPNTPTTTATMPSTLPTPSDVNAMPYKVLQTTLKTLRQPATGGTLDLKRRLLTYLQSQTQPEGPGEPAAPPEDAASTAPAPPSQASGPTDSGQTAVAVPVPAAAPATAAATAAAAAPLMSSGTALPAALAGSGLGTGNGGAGFPTPAEADDASAEDDGDDDASDGDGDGAKSKKAAHFTLHEFTRLGHCMTVPELRTALASIMKGKSQEQIDAGYDGWVEFAEYFNDADHIFLHPDLDEDGEYAGSPRIDTSALDPNKLSEKRSAKQLKAKWGELKKYLTKYFANWNASGQMTSDVAEKSISDFLCVGQKHPKERLIKYNHLVFRGDEDLMCFASKLIGEHGVESGVTKPQGGSGSGGKKRKHLDGDALAAAMATESPAQKKMATAWETEAAAKSAEVALQLIQQLGSAPDAFKPLLEARIKQLLGGGNGPEAPPAAQ